MTVMGRVLCEVWVDAHVRIFKWSTEKYIAGGLSFASWKDGVIGTDLVFSVGKVLS